MTCSPQVCAACDMLLSETPFREFGNLSLVQCNRCETWTSLPRPTQACQSSLHDTGEYFDHPYFRARRDKKTVAAGRCQIMFNQINRVMDPASFRGARMLDVGCDDGSFMLAAAELYGVRPIGVDVSSRAVQVARSQGLHVVHGVLEEASPELGGFKIVSAVDVLEHVVNPAAFLGSVRERMAPGGVLYLQTPNPASAVYGFGRALNTITGGRPSSAIKRLFPPEHVQYFSGEGLRTLAGRCGFDVADLSTRMLPVHEIVAGRAVLVALGALQWLDRLRHTEILLCGILRKR